MIRPTFARVDLIALRSNVAALRRYLAAAAARTPPGLIAVVKANAYGHGLVPIARTLEETGVEMLACADLEEAVALREAGIRSPILVFGALSVSDLEALFTRELLPTISTPAAGQAVQRAAHAHGRRIRCHLKIDTGMNRLGFRHDNLQQTLPPILASAHLQIDAVYTHFAAADDVEDDLFEVQCKRFERVRQQLRGRGFPAHAANSAALLRSRDVWYDFVRPGLLLYGLAPTAFGESMSLTPVMSIHSRVVAVKGVRRGERVGYGGRFVASRPLRLAVVPAGYADGLDVRLEGRGSVLIRGQAAPIVGAVSMDMITVDVTDLAVQPGDDVVIIGRQGGSRIEVPDVAAAIGTLPYEILCRVGSRIERIYNPP